MFYKKFARNLFQHSTKFLIVLSLASFLAACASSDDDDEKAPAKKPTHNDSMMPTETTTLTEALEKTASVGAFATDPDMNMLKRVAGAGVTCAAVDTVDSFPLESLDNTEVLKEALGKISNGLSHCETVINNAVKSLMEDVKDATVVIGTETTIDNGIANISYGGLVEDASGALNVTDLRADSTASAHWLWQGSSDSTVSLVVYVDSASTAYAIGKQESAGKGVFKIYCKTNVNITSADPAIISYCLQYRYSAAAGDFDANTFHAVDPATANNRHYIGNLKVPHAYAFTTGTGTNMADKLSTGLADLETADYADYTYDKFQPITALLATMVGVGRENRKTALQTTNIKDQVTAIGNALNYSAKATDNAKLAKAYEELMAGTAGAK